MHLKYDLFAVNSDIATCFHYSFTFVILQPYFSLISSYRGVVPINEWKYMANHIMLVIFMCITLVCIPCYTMVQLHIIFRQAKHKNEQQMELQSIPKKICRPRSRERERLHPLEKFANGIGLSENEHVCLSSSSIILCSLYNVSTKFSNIYTRDLENSRNNGQAAHTLFKGKHLLTFITQPMTTEEQLRIPSTTQTLIFAFV